jgi:acyl-CoA thioester hydrolase
MGSAHPSPSDDVPLSGRIAEGVHILPVRVHWEDTDAGGIVYHASHIRFMERGRTEMLRVLGLDQTRLREDHGINYVVARIGIDYRAPGFFDMALRVLTTVVRLGAARLELRQVITHGETVLAEALVRCAGIGRDGKPCVAPADVRAAFAPMLKRDG